MLLTKLTKVTQIVIRVKLKIILLIIAYKTLTYSTKQHALKSNACKWLKHSKTVLSYFRFEQGLEIYNNN